MLLRLLFLNQTTINIIIICIYLFIRFSKPILAKTDNLLNKKLNNLST